MIFFVCLLIIALSVFLKRIVAPSKPISLDEVRYLASREDMVVSNGNSMHCKIHGRHLYCEYTRISGEADSLLFEINFRKGKITAVFQDGRLLRWSDGNGTYRVGDFLEPCNYQEIWIWESILGAIQNVVAIQKKLGAQII